MLQPHDTLAYYCLWLSHAKGSCHLVVLQVSRRCSTQHPKVNHNNKYIIKLSLNSSRNLVGSWLFCITNFPCMVCLSAYLEWVQWRFNQIRTFSISESLTAKLVWLQTCPQIKTHPNENVVCKTTNSRPNFRLNWRTNHECPLPRHQAPALVLVVGSPTHKTLNSYNYCLHNSNKMYFGALESPFNR